MRALLVLGACGAALLACQSAPEVREALTPPTVAAQDFQVVNQSLTDCAVKFTAQVEAGSEAVTIDRADYEFVVDGNVLKTGSLKPGTAVAAGATGSLTLEEKFTYVRDEEELKALDARGGALLVALRGTLQLTVAGTRKVQLEFARGRDVRTPRLPHLRLVEWEGGRFSESEVQVVYHLGVVNENPFLIAIAGVDYAITLAGKEVAKGTIGAGDRVSAASTGVFDVTALVNEETHGKDARKLIKGLRLPYQLTGTLRAALYTEHLSDTGEVKLTPPK